MCCNEIAWEDTERRRQRTRRRAAAAAAADHARAHFFFGAVTVGVPVRVVAELGGFGLLVAPLAAAAEAEGGGDDAGFFAPADVGLAADAVDDTEDAGDTEGFADEPALPGLLSRDDDAGEELGCCGSDSGAFLTAPMEVAVPALPVLLLPSSR